ALTTLYFVQADDGIRDRNVTGVQTCALPISFDDILFIGGDNDISKLVDPLRDTSHPVDRKERVWMSVCNSMQPIFIGISCPCLHASSHQNSIFHTFGYK